MDGNKRDIIRVVIGPGRVTAVYETADGQVRKREANAIFDHEAALELRQQAASVQGGQQLYRKLLLSDPSNPAAYYIFDHSFDAREHGLQVRLEILVDLWPQLLELNWEQLVDLGDRFLALDDRFEDYGFVRCLRANNLDTKNLHPSADRPRVLIVVSNPSNGENVPFGMGAEATTLHFDPIESKRHPKETLALAGLFQQLQADELIGGFDILRGDLPPPHDTQATVLDGYPTLSRINEVLAAAEDAGNPYHVLHFLAHGYLDNAGKGYLLLTNSDGAAHLVPEDKFKSLFPSRHQLRLVVLAACQSGEGVQQEQKPLAGLAQAFLRAGIPALIAMQDEISKQAAAVFTQSFYKKLVQNGMIDTAVVEARRAIDRATTQPDEWQIPVLYMQSDDPRLFIMPGSEEGIEIESEPDPVEVVDVVGETAVPQPSNSPRSLKRKLDRAEEKINDLEQGYAALAQERDIRQRKLGFLRQELAVMADANSRFAALEHIRQEEAALDDIEAKAEILDAKMEEWEIKRGQLQEELVKLSSPQLTRDDETSKFLPTFEIGECTDGSPFQMQCSGEIIRGIRAAKRVVEEIESSGEKRFDVYVTGLERIRSYLAEMSDPQGEEIETRHELYMALKDWEKQRNIFQIGVEYILWHSKFRKTAYIYDFKSAAETICGFSKQCFGKVSGPVAWWLWHNNDQATLRTFFVKEAVEESMNRGWWGKKNPGLSSFETYPIANFNPDVQHLHVVPPLLRFISEQKIEGASQLTLDGYLDVSKWNWSLSDPCKFLWK